MPYYLRPAIKYEASCAILCRSGKDLGATMTGHHDFQLADDIIHKVHIGHYTFYSVAVVKNDKLFIKARGVFSRKYISGEDADSIKVEGKGEDGGEGRDEPETFVTVGRNDDCTLFSEDGDGAGKLIVKGTYVARNSSHINPLGFGAFTYQGCKAGREGRGMPMKREYTVNDIKRIQNDLNIRGGAAGEVVAERGEEER